jgi:argininosuccinate lyase
MTTVRATGPFGAAGGEMRLWGGRFTGETDERMAAFTRSVDIDAALALDDLDGSVAHVHGLGRAGLLTSDEVGLLEEGLAGLRREVEAGTFAWDPALEDVHMNLESALAERIGPVAGKVHTGRSRNDQVATDLRLWLRRTAAALDGRLLDLEDALVGLAQRDGGAVLPGTTHIQPAQPVLLAHHLLAYVEMLERDRGRFTDTVRRANLSPLGSGAIAGAGYPLDREATARELGFDGPTANSIDATSDRDFVVEAGAAAALAMVHLSRLAEEVTWWSSPRFGYVRVADAFSTGSSMMPNKKNPDPAELVRGRTGRVIGDLVASLAMLKGLPLAYQRDLQEDKPALFDALATLDASLEVMAGLVTTLSVDRDRMRTAAAEGHTTATAVADALVRRGVPFRAAHHVVGRLVAEAERSGVALGELGDEDLIGALAASEDPAATGLALVPGIAAELRRAAEIEAALESCDVVGGTAPRRVSSALVAARARIDRDRGPAGDRGRSSAATGDRMDHDPPR